MGFGSSKVRFLTVLLFAGFMSAVAGCQSDDAGSVLDPGTGGGTTPPADGKILQSELRAYCPKVTLLQAAAVHDTFQKKGEADPTKLVYRSSITAVTRKCAYGGGMITMDVAAAGRVIPGPLAADGNVSMPIVVTVTRGEETLYSNKAKYDVAVSKAAGATQFIFHDANVTFPMPEPNTVVVSIGYEQGPKPKTSELDLDLQ
jgi:hypothetical protein